MGRIIDYPEISSFLDDDYLIVDGATGSTRKILGQTVVGVTDPEPIEDSTNPVQSGGVYNALDEIASDIDDLREDAYSIYPTKAASSTDTDPIVSIEDAADDTPLKRMLAYIVPSMSGSGVPSKTNIRNFKVVSNLELYRTAKNMINPYNMFQESPTKVLLGVTQSNEKIFLKSGTYTINVRNTSGERLTAKWEVQDIADIYTSNTIVLNEDGFVSIYVEDDSGISRSDIRTGFTLAPGEEALAYGTSNSGKYETTISFPYDRPVYLGTLDLVKGELLVTGFLFHRNSSQMNNTEDEPGWKDIGVYGGRLTPGTVNVKRYWAGPANRVRYTYVNVGQKYVVRANGNGYDIILPKADYNYTQSQWISAAIDVQIIVPYSTPISYTIDPLELRTISGYNRYFTDSGNVALTYCINLNTFVNGKIDPEISNLDNKIDGVDARLTSEISEAEEAIDNVSERTTAIEDTFPTGTASGSVARFVDDISGIPVKSCIAQIEPKQDLHGQESPYPAGGGKNLLQTTITSTVTGGITYTVNTDGTISLSGTASESYVQVTIGSISLAAGSYVISDGGLGSANIETYISGITGASTKAGGSFVLSEAVTNKPIYFWVKGGTNVTGKVVKPMIRLSSVTDSTYAPYSNICPISGWTGANVVRTGKNLFDQNTVYASYKQTDGSFIGERGSINQTRFNIPSTLVGRKLTFSAKAKLLSDSTITTIKVIAKVGGVEKAGDQITSQTYALSAVTFTPTSDNDYVWISYGSGDGNIQFKDVQLEFGSTATEYTPFVDSDTYPITFPSEAGTVYGGTLDVTNGTLTVDRAIKVFDGVNNTVSSVSASMATGNYFCVLPLSGAIANSTNLLSNMLKNDGTQIANLGNIYILSNGNAVGVLPDQTLTTAAAVNSWLAQNNIQLFYQLATPTTYQLTPTEIKSLLGDNNIWADTGDIDVTYRINPHTYIEEKLLTLYPTDTVTGSATHFPDGADDIPVKSCVVDVLPNQDLHGYDHPWPGGGGVNLAENMSLSLSDLHGITVNAEDDGTITINGTSQGTSYIRGYFHCPDQTATYTWAVFNAAASTDLEFSVRNSSYNPAGGWAPLRTANMTLTFTIDSGETADYWQFAVKDGATINNVTLKPIIVSGSTAPTAYSPYSNICPISGWTGAQVVRTGKNLLKNTLVDKTTDGITIVVNPDKTITVNGTSSGWVRFDTGEVISLKAGTYTFSQTTVGTEGYFALHKVNEPNNTYATLASKLQQTFTVDTDFECVLSFIVFSGKTISQKVYSPMLEVGSTASAYSPYTGDTYSITFPSEAGTVYGGTLDVTNGVLTVDRAMVTLDGTENYVGTWFPSVVVDKLFPVGAGDGNDFVNSHLPSITNACNYASPSKRTFQFSNVNTWWGLSSADELKAVVAQQYANGTPVTVCYPLAEPTVYTLTPTEIKSLLGDNTIFADCGDTTVNYRADTGLFITKKLGG